ncbi:hypothetical protein QBC37DRAFT_401496 [Rhypophila decipiens]|uniref:Uncharacterized protein n=1 Tax=Rhypophila decipiens TaxID=261697 RepID=A0AAN6Y6U3_9PEZI|nr:hypothetical protein QBC37DRAFT_401496 [Rhypophila decipiens]
MAVPLSQQMRSAAELTIGAVRDAVHLAVNDIWAAADPTNPGRDLTGNLLVEPHRLLGVIIAAYGTVHPRPDRPSVRALSNQLGGECVLFLGLAFTTNEVASMSWPVYLELFRMVREQVPVLPRCWLFHPAIVSVLLDLKSPQYRGLYTEFLSSPPVPPATTATNQPSPSATTTSQQRDRPAPRHQAGALGLPCGWSSWSAPRHQAGAFVSSAACPAAVFAPAPAPAVKVEEKKIKKEEENEDE